MIDDGRFELLNESHHRAAFMCSGEHGSVLEGYLRNDNRAMREHRRGVCAVHVLVQISHPLDICGFFTLSAATVEIEDFPKRMSRELPLYRPMPAIKLGRMAMADDYRGADLGTLLIDEAFRICLRLRDSLGFVALLVDAKSDALVSYYVRRGFTRFPERRQTLYCTQDSIAQIITAKAAL